MDEYCINTNNIKMFTINVDKKSYGCLRGHTFSTSNPIIIAVDEDPEYNSGPVCPYCYVNWFRMNVGADEE